MDKEKRKERIRIELLFFLMSNNCFIVLSSLPSARLISSLKSDCFHLICQIDENIDNLTDIFFLQEEKDKE